MDRQRAESGPSQPWGALRDYLRELDLREPIPPNAMRVGPGTDAVVWSICPGDGVEL